MTVSGSAHEDDCYCWGDGGDRPTINKAIQLSPLHGTHRVTSRPSASVYLRLMCCPTGRPSTCVGVGRAKRKRRVLCVSSSRSTSCECGGGVCVWVCGGWFIYIYVCACTYIHTCVVNRKGIRVPTDTPIHTHMPSIIYHSLYNGP